MAWKMRDVTVRASGCAMVLIGCLACGDAGSDKEATAGPWEPSVEIFAQGTVSSDAPEFATSFSRSGDTVFFNRASADRSRIDLMYSVRTGPEWSPAEVFGPLAGVRAFDPFVSLDGTALYFTANLPRDGIMEGSFDLWRLALGVEGAEPEPLPEPINSSGAEFFNSAARDGTMMFASERSGDMQIYEARFQDGAWTTPMALDFEGEGASNPAIHPEGGLLVFARADESGTADLFVSCREASGWGAPIRLPEPVNSDFTDFAPGFDATHLYFTSERPGVMGPVADSIRPPGDIYRTELDGIEGLCSSE